MLEGLEGLEGLFKGIRLLCSKVFSMAFMLEGGH
jgi:hypothetical protein